MAASVGVMAVPGMSPVTTALLPSLVMAMYAVTVGGEAYVPLPRRVPDPRQRRQLSACARSCPSGHASPRKGAVASYLN